MGGILSADWKRALAITWVIRALTLAALVWLFVFVCELSTVALVVIGVIAFIALVLVPWLARNQFRQRIAQMRRSVLEEIQSRKLPRPDRTWALLPLSATDDGARSITLLQVVVFELFFFSGRYQRRLRYDELDAEWTRALVQMRPRRSRRIRAYDTRWRKYAFIHLFLGTPFGWFAGGILALYLGVLVLITLVTRPNRTVIKWRVTSRIKSVALPLVRRVKYESGAWSSES